MEFNFSLSSLNDNTSVSPEQANKEVAAATSLQQDLIEANKSKSEKTAEAVDSIEKQKLAIDWDSAFSLSNIGTTEVAKPDEMTPDDYAKLWYDAGYYGLDNRDTEDIRKRLRKYNAIASAAVNTKSGESATATDTTAANIESSEQVDDESKYIIPGSTSSEVKSRINKMLKAPAKVGGKAIADAIEAEAIGGWSFAYYAPKAALSALDMVFTGPINWGYRKFTGNSDNLIDPLSQQYQESWGELTGTDGSFKQVFNTAFGDVISLDQNQYANFGEAGGKILADIAWTGGAIRQANILMGIKPGFYGTEKSWQATKEAGILAQIGKTPTKELLKEMAVSLPTAISQGITRSLVGEVAYISANFDGEYGTTWDSYSDMYTSNPTLSYSLLLGGTFFDTYSTMRAASNTINKFISKATEVKNTITNIDIKSTFGSGEKFTSHTNQAVNSALAIEDAKRANSIIEAAMAEKVNQGVLNKDTYESAVNELRQSVDIATEQLKVNVEKLYKGATSNTADYNMITKAAINSPDLIRAAVKLESFKTSADAFVKMKANKGLLLRTTWNKVKQALGKAKKLEAAGAEPPVDSYYVINSEGYVIPAERYEPTIADLLNTKKLRQDDIGFFHYDAAIAGKGKQIALNIQPTYETAERYAYLAEKNAEVFLAKSDVKKVQNVFAEMESMAQTNPYVAQTMAGLLDRHPELSTKYLTFSKSQYRKMADNGIKKIFNQRNFLNANDPDMLKLANKLGLTVLDNDKFFANVRNPDASIRGIEFGAIDNAIYRAPTEVEKALLLTVNDNMLADVMRQHELGEITKVQELARQKSLIDIGENNPLLNNISRTFIDNPIVNEARNVDAFGYKFLPQSARIFFQRHFGFGSNATLQATRRLAEYTQNATYAYLGERLGKLRDASQAISSADKIQLNKFKKLVNMGFEITDDFKLATNQVPVDSTNLVDSVILGDFEEVLTNKNIMALERAQDLGLINNADEIIESVDTRLLDLSNAFGDELVLNESLTNYLTEYNSVNREIYSGRQEIANIMGANKSYIQNFHMPSPSGKYVNFIVDNNNQLVTTVTGATPAQLKKSVELEEKLLKEYGVRGNKYKVLTYDDMERLHKEGLIGTDEWRGWEDIQGNAANLKYESGRTERTMTGASFVYDDNILENLYDSLIKQGRKLGQEYQSAFFDKERQYAARLLDSTSDPEMKNLYNEYIGLLGGENRTTGIMKTINQSISDITDKLRIFEPAVSIRDAVTDKKVKAILKNSGELDTMNAFIAKLPKASGAAVTVKLQSATNWAMLRFAKASYAMLNILSLIPMSNLSIGFLQKGKFETVKQQATRLGWYGDVIDLDKGVAKVNWFGSMRATIPDMFNGKGKRILADAKKFGYLNDVDMVLHEMVYQPHLTINNPEASRMRKLIGRTAEKVNKAGTVIGDWSERISREFSYTMGYNIAEKMGTNSEHVKHMFAKQFSDNIVGNYSAIAKAAVFRGPVPAMLGLFRTYSMNVAQVLADTYAHGGMKALLKPLAAQAITFGTRSLPMSEALEEFVFPVDGKEDGYQKLVDFCGGDDKWAKAIYYGPLSAALNIDFSTRGEINPISGGFLPLSGNFSNWTMKDINPFFQMVSDSYNLGKGVYDEMSSSLPFTDQRFTELLSMYAPISSIRGFARLNTYQLDADGNKVFYRTDRAGKMHSINALASVLGMNSVGEQREFDVTKRIAQRNLIDQKNMDKVRQAARGLFRAYNSGRVEIDADVLKNVYDMYIKAHGNPLTFATWLSTNFSISTTPTTWNMIKVLSKSKDPMAIYDIQRLLSVASWEEK